MKEFSSTRVRIILPIVTFIMLVAFDQITKLIAVVRLKPIGTYPVIPGILSFTYLENSGAGFGILQGARWFFIVFTVVVLIGIVWYYIKLPQKRPYNYVRAGLVILASGAVGNGIDRLLNGFVIDFLHVRFINFPIFNIADIYVSIATFMLAIIMLFFIKEDDKI
ncbi:MAG: signal peptidase II [Defluviitaleaceae bacterium]|nr:signal peptidase II [Defluviitaleaceae bacterium]